MKNLEEKLKGEFGAFIETVLGGIFGIIFSYILKDDIIGVAIFSMGCLISLSRYLLYGYLAKEFEAVFTLYQMKDSISYIKDRDFAEELINSPYAQTPI